MVRVPKRKIGAVLKIKDKVDSIDCASCQKCCRGINSFSFKGIDPFFETAMGLKNSGEARRHRKKFKILLNAKIDKNKEIDHDGSFGVITFASEYVARSCLFLEEEVGCTINPKKPFVCKQFPFIKVPNPDRKNSFIIILSEFCPGMEELRNYENKRKDIPFIYEHEVLKLEFLRDSYFAILKELKLSGLNPEDHFIKDEEGRVLFPIEYVMPNWESEKKDCGKLQQVG